MDAIGPNSSGSTSTGFGGPGNDLLTDLANSFTNDAVVLEFDFEVQSEKIEFNFNFLSEEYNEWVGSQFNDVFAFFISGPGISGEENLAVVPGTSTPVSVNTINNDSFWQFYHDNQDGNTNIEFDGFTTLLTAEKDGLIPCETYTLKLMIADAGDDIYDACVLLQENSLKQENISAITSTYIGTDVALEGCIEASFTFELEEALDRDIEIPFLIEGTAVNGVDYEYIDPVIVIPEGQTSATIIINSFLDGTNEGQESIELIFTPQACEEPDTVKLYIDDFQPIEFTATETPLSCFGYDDGQALFSVTGGFPPYLINLTDTLTGELTSYSANPVTHIPQGTYSVQIIDNYGCTAEDIVFGDIFNAGTTFLPTGTGVTYETAIEITGFSPGETLESVDQLQQISAVMEHSYANDLSITLRAPNGSEVTLKIEGDGLIGSNPNNSVDMGEPVSSGRVDQWNADNITPGIGYEYVWNDDPTYLTMSQMVDNQLLPEHTYISTWGNELTDYYYPEGSYTPEEDFTDFLGTELNGEWTIIVTDFYILDNGYIFEWGISLSSPQSDSIITISEPALPVVTEVFTLPDCGIANGSVDITVTGDQTPYSYLWNTGDVTEDLINVASGPYTLELTGDDNCSYEYQFNLSDNGTLLLDSDIENESCIDAENGSIDLIVDGGTPNFTYSWNTGQSSEDISNLAPGDYTVTVNDASNCSAVETFTVEEAVPLSINVEITDENCGDKEGAINITVNGGIEPYDFVWSNGETSEDIDELEQGEYTVIITDAADCTYEETFMITNYVGNCIPDCDLEITNSLVTDETCGLSNGAIDITVFTSNSPLTFQWSNGSTDEDLTALSEGDYTVTITDNETCELTESFTIINDAGNLTIIDTEVTNETCGNEQGSIDVTVNGGALPYAFQWNSGDESEDLMNIHEGTYQLIVTDANGCSVSGGATVENEAGDLEMTWSYSFNETCGNGNGSIDILIEGGTQFFFFDYIYEWSNGSSNEDLINIHEGVYSCLITDANGCQITTPEFVIENLSGDLEFDEIDVDNEICSNGLGEIELYVIGGEGPYNYQWSNGETNDAVFNLSAGIYSAQVTDDNGCMIETGDIEIVNEAGTLSLEEIETIDEICGNNQGSINLLVAGGSLPYNSLWNTGSTSEDLLNISEGNYSCIITDANGCEINFSTTIFNDQGTLDVLNTVVSDETCGTADGAIDLIINGGTQPYAYLWDTGDTNEDLTNLTAGSYSCVITDAQGCMAETNAEVMNDVGDLSLDNYILTNELCGAANGSINLIVSGSNQPFSYNWTNGATSQDINNLEAGVYSCQITDALGCILNVGPFTVNNTSESIFTDYEVVHESCGIMNGSIDLTVTGGTLPLTYLWSTGETTEDLNNLSAGTYTYTVTDNAGCSLSGDILVMNNAGDLSLDGFASVDEICSNGVGAIDISVSGGALPYTFLWNTGANTEDLSSLNAGEYSVLITDNNGCQISSQTFTINNNPGDFELSSIIVTDETCNNGLGAIEVNLAGGSNPISYTWNNGALTKDISNISEGVYTCVAADNNGCELNYSAVVENSSGDLSAIVEDVSNATCGEDNGSIDISILGGADPISFEWSNGEITEDITDLPGGFYTCIITDDSGCEANLSAEVEDIGGDFELTVLNIVDEECNNQNGSIDVAVSGGTPPYEYSWSNGAITQDIFNLEEGVYELTVTDDFGCVITSQVSIDNIVSDIEITDIIITDEMCDMNSGSIEITPMGGTEPYTYLWSNGSTAEDLFNISAGEYTVTITDDNGCSEFESFSITNIITLDLTSAASNETCGQSNGSIDLTINVAFGTVSFLWNTGETTEDLLNIPAGFYECIVSDEAGCTEEISFELINETGDLLVSETVTDDICGLGGSVELIISGASGGYSVLWSNGSTEDAVFDLEAGTYSVEVTNLSDGCVFYDSYEIETLGLYSVNEVITNSSCETCDDGAIDLTPDPVDTYVYAWSNGDETEDINGLLPGEYSVLITNPLGCEFEESYSVDFLTSVQSTGGIELKVYPNPTEGTLHIEYASLLRESVLSVIDMTGMKVYETKLTDTKAHKEIDISNFATGVYFLTIENEDQQKTIKIFKHNK